MAPTVFCNFMEIQILIWMNVTSVQNFCLHNLGVWRHLQSNSNVMLPNVNHVLVFQYSRHHGQTLVLTDDMRFHLRMLIVFFSSTTANTQQNVWVHGWAEASVMLGYTEDLGRKVWRQEGKIQHTCVHAYPHERAR